MNTEERRGRWAVLLLVALAVTPGGCLIYVEANGGGYGVMGGGEALRPGYGVGLGAGFNLDGRRVRFAVGGASDVIWTRVHGHDGALTGGGLYVRTDVSFARPARTVLLRATGALTLGGGAALQFADGATGSQSYTGGALGFFGGPSVTFAGESGALHVSLGAGGLALDPAGLDATVAVGGVGRVAWSFTGLTLEDEPE